MTYCAHTNCQRETEPPRVLCVPCSRAVDKSVTWGAGAVRLDGGCMYCLDPVGQESIFTPQPSTGGLVARRDHRSD